METYRLFIAVEVGDEAKAELVGAQHRLQRFNSLVKWVAPTMMHLTLHFLGETQAALIPQLCAALDTALVGQVKPRLRLDGAGAFPNLRRPSVVWAGVAGEITTLGKMQAAIGALLEDLRLPHETRPFRPHLTLARARRDAQPAQLAQLGTAIQELSPLAPAPWLVDRVILFRSRLLPRGPEYS
ncbi:MAG TPA: RNA 2',3'-cyclic phosphodiesterase, partial [Roseiflexaceae bacterium]|nr:RNA 2',3'-cyclic phosphodiesterase [Roseiflexaceae bacterium]